MDWKDALQQFKESADLPEGEEPRAEEPATAPQRKPKLTIGIDRRQRRGKTATIIEGFESDEAALEAAAALKKRLGCGGSARGCEVLLQGDRRHQAADYLRPLGYPCSLSGS